MFLNDRGMPKLWVILVGIFLLMMICGSIVFPSSKLFGYAFLTVDTGEVGVQIKRGEFVQVLGPGVYTDPLNLYADIIVVKTAAVNFTADDPEVLTRDLQRIGVTVSGDLFRPGLGNLTEELWEQYRPYYDSRMDSDDAVVRALVADKTKQAMKVCVGERSFEEAVVGEQRNDLFKCIDEQLSVLMSAYGIEVRNVVVPNVAISQAMQQQLDDLTTSRNQILIERQNEELALARGARELAEQQQAIRVEQGRHQEELRQQAINQELERALAEAKQEVIAAQIANEILRAEGDLQRTEIEVEVATQQALATLAKDAAWAKIISENPAYAEYLVRLAIADALGKAGIIIVPAGTDPNLIFGNGVLPSFDVNPQPN